MKKYKFLYKVKFPSDIRKLKLSELKTLSTELREELINKIISDSKKDKVKKETKLSRWPLIELQQRKLVQWINN